MSRVWAALVTCMSQLTHGTVRSPRASSWSSHLSVPVLSRLHHFIKWAVNQQQVDVETASQFPRGLSSEFCTDQVQVTCRAGHAKVGPTSLQAVTAKWGSVGGVTGVARAQSRVENAKETHSKRLVAAHEFVHSEQRHWRRQCEVWGSFPAILGKRCFQMTAWLLAGKQLPVETSCGEGRP